MKQNMQNVMKFVLLGCLLIIFGTLQAQEIKVTGTVKGPDNEALPGVNVVIQGTQNGTITDFDGNYTLMVPNADATLVFSFIGYQTQSVNIAGKTTIDVILNMDEEVLDEVIVVGYGTVKKSDLTGSISSVTAEQLTTKPVTTLDQALQGQAAGVQVSEVSGRPGAATSIRIRGHGALLTSNGPLWVIDGYVGGDINSVAPEDIERMEVLKDAATTAIYGARGGNGVIIVTTKRGKANQSRIDFTHYTQYIKTAGRVDLLNQRQFMTLRNQALINEGFDPLFTEDQINGLAPSDEGYIADTDWQDEIFRDALAHYYNLSSSGGNESTRYSMSVNYRTEEGIIHSSGYDRLGTRLNLDHKINNKLSIGTNAKYYRTTTNSFQISSAEWAPGAAGGAITSLPYYPVYDSLGDYFTLNSWDNPVLAAKAHENNTLSNNILANVFAVYQPIEGLTIRGEMQGKMQFRNTYELEPAELFGINGTTGLRRANLSSNRYQSYQGNITATYEKQFFTNHNVKVMAGFEHQENHNEGISVNGSDLPKKEYLWYNIGTAPQDYKGIGSWQSFDGIESQFCRVDYNFAEKYYAEYTYRRDRSSKFGPKNAVANFHSASLAWKLHRESFIENLGLFDELKLRASYGQSGNDNIGSYLWMPRMGYNADPRSNAVFGSVGSPAGDTKVNGASTAKIPNASVHWETATVIDIGLDIALFNERLRMNIDYYDRTTTELLNNFTLPMCSGVGDGWNGGSRNIISNIAEMNNKGIELTIGTDILNYHNLQWAVDVTYSKNINEVLDLAGPPLHNGKTYIEVGQPIGNLYGYRTDGLFQEGDDIANTPTFNGDEKIGDQRYLDANGDGQMTTADEGVIGNALPDFIMGLNSSLTYRNFDLTLNFNAFVGFDLYNGTKARISDGSLGEFNGSADLLNAWTPENTNTDVPRLSDSYVSYTCDRFLEDATFLRLTNARLSYSFPPYLMNKVKIKDLRVYVSGQNLYTWTNYSGIEPQSNTGGTSNLNLGDDTQTYPSARRFTFGIQIGI